MIIWLLKLIKFFAFFDALCINGLCQEYWFSDKRFFSSILKSRMHYSLFVKSDGDIEEDCVVFGVKSDSNSESDSELSTPTFSALSKSDNSLFEFLFQYQLGSLNSSSLLKLRLLESSLLEPSLLGWPRRKLKFTNLSCGNLWLFYWLIFAICSGLTQSCRAALRTHFFKRIWQLFCDLVRYTQLITVNGIFWQTQLLSKVVMWLND